MPEAAVPDVPAPGTGDELVRVMPSHDCPLGTPQEPELRIVTVADTEIILVRLAEGDVTAFASRCPHQGTHLVDASFFDGRLRCPYHLYLYDPRTGENVVPCRDARPGNLWKLKPGYLPTYRVEERDGWIWVAPRPLPPPPSYDPDRERRPVGTRLADPDPPGPSGPAPTTVDHPTKTVRVPPGTTFEVRLPVVPRPGHVWRVEVDGHQAEPGPVKVVSERFDPAEVPRYLVTLTAVGAGVATIRCAYSRPWDAVAAETRTYVVRV
ncbi:MAG: Rieske 2Fe-2S domain-containing protein, partial [Acidimicrobiales bacterium]